MVLLKGRVSFLLLVALCIDSAVAGGLQDREKEVTERSEAKKAPPASSSSSTSTASSRSSDAAFSAYGSGTYPSDGSGNSFLGDFLVWLISSPIRDYYGDRDDLETDEDGEWADVSFIGRHSPGEPTMPYIRLDYHYQWVDNEPSTDVHDGRIELGYKMLAFHGRMTQYRQSDGFTLDLRQYYGVVRIGGSGTFFLENGSYEIGIGAGVVQHTGDVQDDSSGAVTLPMKLYPVDWLGFEFRPAWYKWQEITIGDYDLSASLGIRFVNVRAGYRWLWDNGVVDVQSGPYVGMSFSF